MIKTIPPLILGLGGGIASGSSTEQALLLALKGAEAEGARTVLYGAEAIMGLPIYMSQGRELCEKAVELIAAVRAADGLIIASPGYHGSLSGAVKNAIDYIEETARDPLPYLTNKPVGLIGTAAGYQAAMSTLCTLRTIVHALRGWPTPLGIAFNSRATPIIEGMCTDVGVQEQIMTTGRQVASFLAAPSQISQRRPIGPPAAAMSAPLQYDGEGSVAKIGGSQR